ncbi:MAG: response regulator [bacterium]
MILNPKELKPRILVVDDETDIAELVGSYLEGEGYEIFLSTTGNEALDFIRYGRPHLVLLDVRMHGMGGLEVLEKIKEMDPRVGVLMITALQDEDLGRQALKLGASDFITKPINFEYLNHTIQYKLSAMLSDN